MRSLLVSLDQLSEAWQGKTKDALGKMVKRGRLDATWLCKQEALKMGLPWGEGGGGGKNGKRPYVKINSVHIPSSVKLKYHEALLTAAVPCSCVSSSQVDGRSSACSSRQAGAGTPACPSALNHPGTADVQNGVEPSASVPGAFSQPSQGFEQLSDTEVDREIYAELPEYNRKIADKYQVIVAEMGNLKGRGLLKAINEWNMAHPDFHTSYPRVVEARKILTTQGKLALVGKYGKSSKTTVKDEWFDVFKGLFLKEGGPSVYICWVMTLGQAKTTDSTVTAESFPSSASFQRRLDKEIPASTVYLHRNGYSKWNRKYGYFLDRDYSNILCGQVYVSDHAQWDVIVKTGKGQECCPWMTAIADFKSGKFLAWVLYADSPSPT